MLTNGWNFHGWIAVPLEQYGRKLKGSTCYTADAIESGEFVSAMLEILNTVYSNPQDIAEFADIVRPYAELSAQDIPHEKADEMFNEFKRLIENRESM